MTDHAITGKNMHTGPPEEHTLYFPLQCFSLTTKLTNALVRLLYQMMYIIFLAFSLLQGHCNPNIQ